MSTSSKMFDNTWMRVVLLLVLLSSLCTQATAATPTATPQSCSTPSPPQYRCGVHGTLSKPAVITSDFTAAAATLDMCRDACVSTSNCISFSFQDPAGPCQLLSKPIIKQGYKKGTTTNPVLWNVHCFTCTPISPTPPLCNMTQAVIDPGFELQPLGSYWTAVDSTGTGFDQGYLFLQQGPDSSTPQGPDAHSGVYFM